MKTAALMEGICDLTGMLVRMEGGVASSWNNNASSDLKYRALALPPLKFKSAQILLRQPRAALPVNPARSDLVSGNDRGWCARCLKLARPASGSPCTSPAPAEYALCELRPAKAAATPRLPACAGRGVADFPANPQVDKISGGGNCRAGDDILKLSHIARPGMLQQHRLRAPR